MRRATIVCAMVLQSVAGLQLMRAAAVAPAPSRAGAILMGRKFENNKLKMAKTALACARLLLLHRREASPLCIAPTRVRTSARSPQSASRRVPLRRSPRSD